MGCELLPGNQKARGSSTAAGAVLVGRRHQRIVAHGEADVAEPGSVSLVIKDEALLGLSGELVMKAHERSARDRATDPDGGRRGRKRRPGRGIFNGDGWQRIV